MKSSTRAAIAILFALAPCLAEASDKCSNIRGDAILAARTPQVDLYDGANGKRVQTVDKNKFPTCIAVTARAPNMMLGFNWGATAYWVQPHMVYYRLLNKKPAICRNLAMGGDQKVGSTRALGEDCPKTVVKP